MILSGLLLCVHCGFRMASSLIFYYPCPHLQTLRKYIYQNFIPRKCSVYTGGEKSIIRLTTTQLLFSLPEKTCPAQPKIIQGFIFMYTFWQWTIKHFILAQSTRLEALDKARDSDNLTAEKLDMLYRALNRSMTFLIDWNRLELKYCCKLLYFTHHEWLYYWQIHT